MAESREIEKYEKTGEEECEGKGGRDVRA